MKPMLRMSLPVIVCLFMACSSPETSFKKAKAAGTVEAYTAFAQKYPDSPYAEMANVAIDQLDWNSAVVENTVKGFEQYLAKHPNIAFEKDVRDLIELLKLGSSAADSNPADDAVGKIEKIWLERVKRNNGDGHRKVEAIQTQAGVPSSHMTLGEVDSDTIRYYTEFPLDTIPFRDDGGVDALGDGSVHRIEGRIPFHVGNYAAIVGEGDRLNRLTFAVIKDMGYVYLRGKGYLLLEDGSKEQFGY